MRDWATEEQEREDARSGWLIRAEAWTMGLLMLLPVVRAVVSVFR